MLGASSMPMAAHTRRFSATTGVVTNAFEPAPSSTVRPRTTSVDAGARLRRMMEADFDFVWRALRGLGVPAANADDAAQQVFWIASRKLDAIAAGSERSFLFGTARGIAANARRARLRSRENVDATALA